MAFWDNWFNPPIPAQPPTEPNPTTWGRIPTTIAPAAGRGTYTPTGTSVAPYLYPAAPSTLTPYSPTSIVNVAGAKAGGEPAMGYGGGSGAGTWEEAGWLWYYDNNGNPVPFAQAPSAATESGAMTEYQRAMINLQLQQLQRETGMSDAELALRRQELEAQIAYQNANLAWQREQWTQQLAQEQKQYLANLAAEPHSWLEYAAASGQAPVIQPWMLPLMPQDYGVSAGQTIPGWSPTNMTGIPELTNPSAQYQARIGPTAQQQYYGYEQARTGATPEESQWRLWSMAPPSGGRGLTQVR